MDIEEEIEPNVEMDIEDVEEKIEEKPKKSKADIFENRTETETEPIIEPIPEKKEKKKRPLSDKQKAHLERMRNIKKEKNAKTKADGKPIINKKKVKETPAPQPLQGNNNFMDNIADHIFNRLDKKLTERQRILNQQSQLEQLKQQKRNHTRTKPMINPVKRVIAPRQQIKPQYDPYDDCFS